MIEALGPEVLSKVADAAIGKAAEAALNPELALRLQQQEAFRLGELQARELVHREILAERESLAAAELREQMADTVVPVEEQRVSIDSEVSSEVRPGTDLVHDDRLLSESGPARPDGADVETKPQIVQNKEDGCRREADQSADLLRQYPQTEGFRILPERILLDAKGLPIADPVTGECRRLDFVVVDREFTPQRSLEVTSTTAPKVEQFAKEQRIRDAGGTFVREPSSQKLVDISGLSTELIRRP